MANIKINEIKNTVTDEIIELRTDAANDSPESILGIIGGGGKKPTTKPKPVLVPVPFPPTCPPPPPCPPPDQQK
ncbi:hypothetical protein [Microcystis aeruginosa]|jgi:hypothetical protein|uniref:hypothetical protein n=1 Tax=Microcystis aeruginosa TaxID=1126 RepID=UPI00232E960A|nr:hypothetical protein [Microcystis aeruginosa]MDB9392277.1 hypothetical protein [Microcystis aeruginosa CS-579]